MTFVAEVEMMTTVASGNSNISPGDLCVYEFKLPEDSRPGDKLNIEIEGFEDLQFLFAYGLSKQTARSKVYPDSVGGNSNPSPDANSWSEDQMEYEEINNPRVDATTWEESPIEPASTGVVPLVPDEMEPLIESSNKLSFKIEYPNNIYVTLRNIDTVKSDISPFTISFTHTRGLPVAALWKRSMPTALPSDIESLARNTTQEYAASN